MEDLNNRTHSGLSPLPLCSFSFPSADLSPAYFSFFLPPGCGNSSMSGDMCSAGYRSITNIDYSSVCISTMSARYSDCLGMTWHQMDVRQLCFPDAAFDVILEKATLDAMMVEEKTPWEVSPQTSRSIHQALTEVWIERNKVTSFLLKSISRNPPTPDTFQHSCKPPPRNQSTED